jgi:hypothetical protein
MERARQAGEALVFELPDGQEAGAEAVNVKWWGPVTTLPWPPVLEVYCLECRRLVEARPYGGGSKLIPVRHFRVRLNLTDSPDDHTRTCQGMYAPGEVRTAGEDPQAAFYSTLSDWIASMTPRRRERTWSI